MKETMNFNRLNLSAAYFFAWIMLAVTTGCDGLKPSEERAVSSDPAASRPAVATAPAATANRPTAPKPMFSGKLPAAVKNGKLEFRVGESKEVFSFKPSEQESCKLSDGEGKELCKLSFQADGRLKAKLPDDSPLFELKFKEDKVMLKDQTGEHELLKFKLKGDTIDVYLPSEERIFRIKRQDYGWRLEDNAEKTLFRAKRQEDGKCVLRDTSDQTVLYSKDLSSPLGLLFFKIPNLSLEQGAACCLFFMDY